jgi:hypothetical protein
MLAEYGVPIPVDDGTMLQAGVLRPERAAWHLVMMTRSPGRWRPG